MNTKVEYYLDQKREQIEQEKQKRKEELLSSWGILDELKDGITDEEYELLLEALWDEEEAGIENPSLRKTKSYGGKFMKTLAAIIWIGGFIAAAMLGRVPDRWGYMQVNFGLFLGYAAAFFVAGATYWAIGETLYNIAGINNKLYWLNRAMIKWKKNN